MAPQPRAFWPLTIASTNDTYSYNDGLARTATLTPGTVYYDPETYAAAVAAAMTAQSGVTFTAFVSATGRVTLTRASGTWVPTTSDGWAALGFETFGSAAASKTGDVQVRNGWWADRPVRSDPGWTAEATRAQTTTLDGSGQVMTFGDFRQRRQVALVNLPAWKTYLEFEGAYHNESIERLWRDGAARFRWWPDASMTGTYLDLRLDTTSLEEFAPARLYDGKALFGWTMSARRFV
jgi:hypothetical protein